MAATTEAPQFHMFVWIVRIMLPILFFLIWYRLGPGKNGDSENQLTREELLIRREVVMGCEVPESLNNIKMVPVDKEATPASGSRPRPKRGDAKRGDRTRTTSAELSKNDRTMSGDFGFGDFDDGLGLVPEAPGDAGAAAAMATASSEKEKIGWRSLNKEERVHFESLLNFVAFGAKERPKRVFLPTEGCPPPPPPPKKALTSAITSEGGDEESLETSKANTEAQTVLKGAVNTKIGLKSSQVAKDLHEKMSDSQARISEATFTLMVEACINGGDLKGASAFLMKMESNGLCPDSDLLDKVMDLYSESRATEVAEGSLSPASSSAMKRLANSSNTPPKATGFSDSLKTMGYGAAPKAEPWANIYDEDQ